jgi:voltage-gated potassium channel
MLAGPKRSRRGQLPFFALRLVRRARPRAASPPGPAGVRLAPDHPRRAPSDARLDAMNDRDQRSAAGNDPALDDPRGRLADYEARTRTPLDLLALATLWFVVVPPGDFSTRHDVRSVVYAFRLALSAIYAIDIAIRSGLARRHLHYAVTHPLALIAVIFPPVRVLFSFRLVRSVFRRGNLERFLLAATVLVFNGAVIVYLFERHAPRSNIHTLGESVWWSVVTVTTVGYGDFYPVTPQGRVTAGFIMAIGVLTLAVVTAQVASSFLNQGTGRALPRPQALPVQREVTLDDIDRRLTRIEALLAEATAPQAPRRAGPPGQDPRDGPP